MTMSASSSKLSDDDLKVSNIEKELSQITSEIRRLTTRKQELLILKDKLKDEILLKKSNQHTSDDWDHTGYAWSSKVQNVLKSTFNLTEFRPNQLAAINIALSKKDAIVIMPTGSGKSLCYQLPAIVDKGVTVVISPMISLMEDQIGQLKKLNIDSEMLQASNTREENNRVMKESGFISKAFPEVPGSHISYQEQLLVSSLMTENSNLKLLYVSPEKLAKSKTFMTKLQKMYKMGNLARIAIDEVHCCSTWGHDFRPDYQYLNILKPMFPEVPILGLTATATTKVMLDIQKMLQIEGCVVIKAPFNRPNLFYEVRLKPSSQKECIDEISDLLSNRFRQQSGIIYTTSIKDCEDLREELRKKGLRVSAYHARLEPGIRSKVHSKWLSGEYQAVVATIAFGLGIDKPDVRFVIHQSLSKSMENFYQESGRAGRDGKIAHCILYYRLADIFKLSPMVFEQQTGLPNLYNIVDYCLDQHRCRRSIIATYFDEIWNYTDCNLMCDHCKSTFGSKSVDITIHAKSLCSILDHVSNEDISVTSSMLIDLWYKQKVAKVKNINQIKHIQKPTFSKDTGENIIAYLLIKNYLKQDFHFTPYSTISYLKKGPNSKLLSDTNHNINMIISTGKKSEKQNKITENKQKRSINESENKKIISEIDLFGSENEKNISEKDKNKSEKNQKLDNNDGKNGEKRSRSNESSKQSSPSSNSSKKLKTETVFLLSSDDEISEIKISNDLKNNNNNNKLENGHNKSSKEQIKFEKITSKIEKKQSILNSEQSENSKTSSKNLKTKAILLSSDEEISDIESNSKLKNSEIKIKKKQSQSDNEETKEQSHSEKQSKISSKKLKIANLLFSSDEES